jgi:prevent-host-death family protein
MDTTAVADLKARLSRYLRRVKTGHEILVTERGVPIAKIIPLSRDLNRRGRRDRLAKAGILRPGRGRARKTSLRPPTGEPMGAAVLEALLADRDESR